MALYSLGLDATFVGSLQQAVVSGGDLLPFTAVLNQVAGELLPGELVERHIPVKGANHIVAIGGDVVILVSVVAHCVGESDEVEPVDGQALAKVRRKKAVHRRAPTMRLQDLRP